MKGLHIRRVFEAAGTAFLAFFCLYAAPAPVHAQDADTTKYALDVRLEPAAKAANVRATFTLLNPTDAPKRQVQFRILGSADIRSVTVGGQSATVDAKDDRRFSGLTVVSLQLPSAIAGKGTVDITVDYRLALKTNATDATIGPSGSILLPSSMWFPMVNTPFIQYGPNTSPFTLTGASSAGERVVSGGALSGSVYTQPLSTLPFVIAGRFDPPVAAQAAGISFEVLLPENASPQMRAGADRLLKEAAAIGGYYSRVLGPPPAATFRLVTSDLAAGYSSSSGVALGRKILLRDFTDAETFELLADAIARIWIEAVPVRGAAPGSGADRPSGVALVRDILPRYLAILATGDRFGKDGEDASFRRLSAGLLAMGDLADQVQLTLATPFDPSYRGLVVTKGPLAMRILEHEIGREKLLGAVRETLAASRTSGSLTAAALRSAFDKAAGKDLSPLYTTWFDTVVQPDLIIGTPVQQGSGWACALRNLGTGDVLVDVVATTASGKKLTTRASVASEGFGEARFETTEKIAQVEIDPERLIPQKNYSNDARPPRPDSGSLFVEGVGFVKRKDFAAAEAKLKESLASTPTDSVTRVWLARAVLGQGRTAEAEKLAMDAMAVAPIPVEVAAWGNIVLGQAALGANKTKEAAEFFVRGGNASSETSAIKASREGLMAIDRASGQPPTPDASVVKFFGDFDRVVSVGVNTAQAEQLVDSAALPDFVKGLVTSVARKWSTDVLRTEMVGQDEVVVDTRYTIASSGRTEQATTLTRLRREGSGWKIVDVLILDQSDKEPDGTAEQ